MAFVQNSPILFVDILGLAKCTCEFAEDLGVKLEARLLAPNFGGAEADLYVRPRVNYTSIEAGKDNYEATLTWTEKAIFNENSSSGKRLKKRYPGIKSGEDYVHSSNPSWKENKSTAPWNTRLFIRSDHKSYQRGDPSQGIHDDARIVAGDSISIYWTIKLESSVACSGLTDKKYGKGFLIEASLVVHSTLKVLKRGRKREAATLAWSYVKWETSGGSKTRKLEEKNGADSGQT